MPITFGPGGNSDSFKENKLKFPKDIAEYLKKYNLNGYELECGRSLKIGASVYEMLPRIAEENGIYLTLHTPYYISISGEDEEIRLKSVNYIYESALIAHKLGIKKIVVHSGSCAKMTRELALSLAKDTLKKAQEKLDSEGLSEIIICPETMGKINQLGTLSEVLELCGVDERFLPCIDFGHLNARTFGGIKTDSDYETIFDETETAIGFERTSSMHIHFSKIEYSTGNVKTSVGSEKFFSGGEKFLSGGEKNFSSGEKILSGGEKKHLTFEDTQFGPEFEPLIEVIAKRGYSPSIICESDGTQAEDCAVMKRYYESLMNKKI